MSARMVRCLNSSGFRFLMALSLVCGIGLLSLSIWLRPLAAGEQAFEEGELETGLERFGKAEARFEKFQFMKRLLPESYDASRANQFQILYLLGDLDALLDKPAPNPPIASAHFWVGCALFNRALEETEPDARIAWLYRASDEFRNALKLNPEDWDTKFNYELTSRLLAEMEEKAEPPPSNILRPQPMDGEGPTELKG